jgi:YadA head domain repeat (2 copies)
MKNKKVIDQNGNVYACHLTAKTFTTKGDLNVCGNLHVNLIDSKPVSANIITPKIDIVKNINMVSFDLDNSYQGKITFDGGIKLGDENTETSTECGIAIGKGAIANGPNSVAIGKNSETLTGNGVSIGYNTKADVGSVAIGNYALSNGNGAFYGGTNNTAVGNNALRSNYSGGDNTAMGYSSLVTNTSGKGNTGLGTESLFNNIDGNDNVGVGFNSLYSNLSGNSNVAIGKTALHLNNIGTDNVAIGSYAGYYNTGGSHNTFLGKDAGFFNVSGNENVCVGSNSSPILLSSQGSVIIGTAASGTTRSTSVGTAAIADFEYGSCVGYNSYATKNSVAIGYNCQGGYTDAANSIVVDRVTAIGSNAGANGNLACSFGYYTQADHEGSIVLGANGTSILPNIFHLEFPQTPLVLGAPTYGNAAFFTIVLNGVPVQVPCYLP